MNENQRAALIMAAVCYFWEVDNPTLVENVKRGNTTEVTRTLSNAEADTSEPCVYSFKIGRSFQYSFHSSVMDVTLHGDEALQAVKRSIQAFSKRRGEVNFEESKMLNEAPKKSLTQKIKGLLT